MANAATLDPVLALCDRLLGFAPGCNFGLVPSPLAELWFPGSFQLRHLLQSHFFFLVLGLCILPLRLERHLDFLFTLLCLGELICIRDTSFSDIESEIRSEICRVITSAWLFHAPSLRFRFDQCKHTFSQKLEK